jgi:hypothetical protein
VAQIVLSTVPLNYLFLLQSYFKSNNSIETRTLIIAAGVVIAFSLFLYLVNRRTGGSSGTGKNTGSGGAARKFNVFTLRKIASSYGLDKEQTEVLDYVFRNDSVTDPERVMKNPALLDRHFKRTYRIIEKNSITDEEAQERLARLFSLRNLIESLSSDDDASNIRLSENTPAILVNGKNSYPVKVLRSKGQTIVVESPTNALGTPIRIAMGTKVSLSFFTKSSNGFSYDCTVEDVVDIGNEQGLQISHSGRMKPLAKRKFRRISTDIKCGFYFVKIEETGTGKKKTVNLIIDRRKYTGMIKDISIGGCSLKSSAPVQIGSRLKIVIDFEDDNIINVLGQVIRTNRSSAGNIINIKFIKVPKRALNSISILVFGYNYD